MVCIKQQKTLNLRILFFFSLAALGGCLRFAVSSDSDEESSLPVDDGISLILHGTLWMRPRDTAATATSPDSQEEAEDDLRRIFPSAGLCAEGTAQMGSSSISAKEKVHDKPQQLFIFQQ